MIIKISSAFQDGSTELSAFDAALHASGVADRNLLRLSSVIPEGSIIKVLDGPIEDTPGQWGDRLYVVYAEARTSVHNEEAWAGIGWVQSEEDGRGLFVEHEGNSKSQVERDIQNTLKDLMKTRGVDFGKIHTKIVGGTCKDKPVCALVVAVYQASDWNNSPELIKGN